MPGQMGGQRISVNPPVGAAGMQPQQTTAQSSVQHGFPGAVFVNEFCKAIVFHTFTTKFCFNWLTAYML